MITVDVDTSEFSKNLKEYMKYSNRSLSDACNQHAYFIARNGTLTTKGATKEEIAASLHKPSEKYPDVEIAAIVVNSQRAKAAKKGLTGQSMAKAIEKLIRIRQSHRNFLRAGWIPAIRILEKLVPSRKGTRIPPGTDKSNRRFGGALPAAQETFNWKPVAQIWNTAGAKAQKQQVQTYLEDGAQQAVDRETKSMLEYIKKKQQQLADKFWS